MPKKSKRRSRKSKAWITRHGKLGGKGFLSKSSATQHKLLASCVREYGYRSCLGSLMVLNRNRAIKAKHGHKIDALKSYLKGKYGGKGSFGASRKSKRKSRRRRLKRRSRKAKSRHSRRKRKSRKSKRKSRRRRRKSRKSKRKSRRRKSRKSKRKSRRRRRKSRKKR